MEEMKKSNTINPEINYAQLKPAIKFNSNPRLEYSISGLDRLEADTINFDKLINSESELKSIPKIASITSLELGQRQSSKYELSPQITRQKTSEKVKTLEVEDNYEDEYEFEEEEEEEVKPDEKN
jgi:hypothetical protein